MQWHHSTLASVTVGLILLCAQSVRTIEVHEDVHEEPPMGLAPQPDTSPPTPPHRVAHSSGPVNERDVNDPPPGGASDGNFTAFPSNHRPHSGHTSSPLATEVVTPTARPVTTASVTSYTGAPPVQSAGLSSYRAATGPLGRATASNTAIVTDRSVQHQLSGYRKRQLYASAAPRPNATGSGAFSKAFVPSPEVVPFFSEDSPLPATGPVDASYPAGPSDGGDSRWYAGTGLPGLGSSKPPTGGGSSEDTGRWEQKYVWTGQRGQPVSFPQEQAQVHFPTPKGKWKWVPEGEEDTRKPPSDTPFSSSGTLEDPQQAFFGQQPFIYRTPSQNQPYSFDRVPIEGSPPFSVESTIINGTSSSSSTTTGSSSSSESTEGISGGSTTVKLAGKEDAHLKGISPWKKIIHVLSAAIPIGLLISALTPQVVYISPNATQPSIQLQTPTPVSGSSLSGSGLRQRSLTASDPAALVQLVRKLSALEGANELPQGPPDTNLNLLNTSDGGELHGCDWELLCQLAHQGMSDSAGSDPLHRMLWKIVRETPAEWTGRLGLDEVFRLIRAGDCGRLRHTCGQDTRESDEDRT
ncbi:uncharacterized protein LOC128720304 [Anopheles nili]|uniref:uncharacterized protein LOC128720304 n=1 Tax=Anopheles nili TaxID=185578 RepID=UPI00237B7F82|nr:uncharacterized protein LOC128720304 [Anopheles nili]